MTAGFRGVSAVLGFVACSLAGPEPAAGPAFSEWSAPVNLGPDVNTDSSDAGPAVSTDGLSLYFNSNRPGGWGENDIWVSRRTSRDAPWGLPENLGWPVNSGAVEAVPALSRDGHWLFFNSNRAGGHGNHDLWVSYRPLTHDDSQWQEPVNLGAAINSAAFDAGAAFFENDENGVPLLLFGSTRPGGLGSFDIYAASAMPDGSFGNVVPVAELSGSGNDQRPSIRFDGLELFFQSDRVGSIGRADLWVATREAVWQRWSLPVNLGTQVNSTSVDQQPHIAADRETLFFASDRPGGSGGLDIYMCTRVKLTGQ